MAAKSLIKIISERCVKPSSPTPPSCKYYKLSSIDQDQFDSIVSVAFFYRPEGTATGEFCQLLETSLSKVLTYYYPFAGRRKDSISIDCNDEGVEIVEVQIQASMSEVLDQPDHDVKDLLFPQGLLLKNFASGHLLMIQLNHFECGAIGVGICISHKLGDAQTICNFLNGWAEMARSLPKVAASPNFAGASVFPPFDHPFSMPSFTFRSKPCVTRRFVFFSSKISKLKKMVSLDSKIQNPSKVEVITALIFKSAMAATAQANSASSFRPSMLSQTANILDLTIPPLSKTYVGNFVSNFQISATEDREINLSTLVGKLRGSKLEFQERHRKHLKENELKLQIRTDREDLMKIIASNSFDVYLFSSWCRFPFFEVDFGWGKPIFMCMPSSSMKNTIFFLDTQSGDGIEAYITLEEDEMSILEHDEEFLAFASLNPNIEEVAA